MLNSIRQIANDLPHPRPKAAHVCDPPGVYEGSLKCCIGNDIIVPTLGNPHLLPITRHLFIGWYNSIWHITAAADAASTVASGAEQWNEIAEAGRRHTYIIGSTHQPTVCVCLRLPFCKFRNSSRQQNYYALQRFRVLLPMLVRCICLSACAFVNYGPAWAVGTVS